MSHPSPRQLEYQSWERGLFLHFGLRTFYEGFKDFDARKMSPVKFMPTDLDCDQWAETAKRAGFNYIVLTAKHHDGFALWPSATTKFSVASSQWKDGKGDVIAEFVAACRRHDVKIGLYYSPYDGDAPVYDNETAYDNFFITQVAELLEPYGPIDILWFDGCGSENHSYDWPRITSEIRRMQPNILLFNLGDPDFRWIGNEEGYAPLGTRNIVETVPVSILSDRPDQVERKWLPAECDMRMRERNWFYSDQDAHTVKSLEALMGVYYYSCGRGCNLLINIGPDRRGHLPDPDAARLLEFGEEIHRRFKNPIAMLENFERAETGWIYRSENIFTVDHAVIAEAITHGEHIRRFAITADIGRSPITVYEGHAVGARAICAFPPIRTRSLRLDILESDGDLNTLELHHTGAFA